MQVKFSPGGSFAAHKIRYSDKFYSAYFDAEGVLKDIEQTGRWGMQGGIRIKTHVYLDNPRAVPDRCVNIRSAIAGVGRGIHLNRAAYQS